MWNGSEKDDTFKGGCVTNIKNFIDSIRGGKPINELKTVAESTLTAIMGRMSAYTGKAVRWDKALNSQEDLFPPKLAWDVTLPTPKVPDVGKEKLI